MSFCSVKGCRSDNIAVIYYSKPVCEKHWLSHCNPPGHTNLKKEFNINDSGKVLKTLSSIKVSV